jgi:hypothetical protein
MCLNGILIYHRGIEGEKDSPVAYLRWLHRGYAPHNDRIIQDVFQDDYGGKGQSDQVKT